MLLAIVGLAAVLDAASTLLMPVFVAAFAALLFNPLVRRTSGLGCPRWLTALVIVGALVGLLALLALLAYEPALRAIEQTPHVVSELKQRVQGLMQSLLGAERAGRLLAMSMTSVDQTAVAPPHQLSVRADASALLGGGLRLLASVLSTILLLYVMLAYGSDLLRKLLINAPSDRRARSTLRIARRVQRDLSRYVATVTLVNTALGACTALAVYLLGLDDALLWGIMAGMLNFIPYVGPLAGVMVLGGVGLVQHESLHQALLPAAVYLGLNILESQLLTPVLLGARFGISPLVIVVWLMFWGWLWGVLGLLLAMPLLVCIHILLRHAPRAQPLNRFIER